MLAALLTLGDKASWKDVRRHMVIGKYTERELDAPHITHTHTHPSNVTSATQAVISLEEGVVCF